MFIVFEGGEGSGKTTVIKSFCEYLKMESIDYIQTREPGSPLDDVCKKIRSLIFEEEVVSVAEFFLLMAGRTQHEEMIIRPALKLKKQVICDRFVGSTWAYQIYAGGMDSSVMKHAEMIDYNFVLPDLTFYLDVDPQIGLKRARERNLFENNKEVKFDNKTIEYHQKVRDGYNKFYPNNNKYVVRIDTSNRSITEILRIVIDSFSNRKRVMNDR